MRSIGREWIRRKYECDDDERVKRERERMHACVHACVCVCLFVCLRGGEG